ncbi:MAG: hypothetical protein KGI49_02890, partial [Patescibacteria group bacterium]|nr:hypothetical protein [Patescibacteria group bacterium]
GVLGGVTFDCFLAAFGIGVVELCPAAVDVADETTSGAAPGAVFVVLVVRVTIFVTLAAGFAGGVAGAVLSLLAALGLPPPLAAAGAGVGSGVPTGKGACASFSGGANNGPPEDPFGFVFFFISTPMVVFFGLFRHRERV